MCNCIICGGTNQKRQENIKQEDVVAFGEFLIDFIESEVSLLGLSVVLIEKDIKYAINRMGYWRILQ